MIRWGAALRRHLYLGFVVFFLSAAAGIHFAEPFFLQALRLLTFDQYARLNPAESISATPVRIIDIDDESLARIGQWPWPRTVMAELLTNLHAKGAAVIAFDMMFAEPDRASISEVVKSLPPERAAVLANLTREWEANDDLFARAVASAPTVLANTLTDAVQNSASLPVKAGFAVAGNDPKKYLRGFDGFIGNLPALTEAAAGVGSINWVPDRDGLVRRVPLLFRVGDGMAPSLAAEALRVAQGASTFVVKAANASGETAYGGAGGVNHVRIGNFDVPTDADGGIWVNYRLSDRTAFIPVWKVLRNEVELSEIEGKILFIGTSAAGLGDLRATPLEAAIPGVEIHKQIVEHVISGRPLTRPDYAPGLELAVILILGFGLAMVFPRVPAGFAAIIGLGAVGLINLAAGFAYVAGGLLFDPLYPSICILVLAGAAIFYLYRRGEIQRAEIRSAFGRYVSPAVVQQLIAHPERQKLGGELRELTLMFCDVRSFTKISEGLTAVEVTSFINELLTPLSEIVIAKDGTIDKYMGDAMMAFWNAPIDDPHHARHACDAAIGIVHGLAAMNDHWRAKAKESNRPFVEVKLGIGINTGNCCVGNLGSNLRFDYSAIGDDVNVASRIEGLTKLYGIAVLMGEATAAQIPDRPSLEIDLVRVKGREQPSRLFTPLTILDLDPSRYAELIAAQATFFDRYRNSDWAGAEMALGKCRGFEIEALDHLYALYEMRIQSHKRSPPPNWDGVFVAVEK